MHKFITKNLNVIAIYFFYIKDQLVYIGRTSNLKDRLYNHFNINTIDFQDWKLTVTNIKYIECKTNTDSDILETYFINKYKPIYNKDKLYVDECSFELIHDNLKEVEKIDIKENDCDLIVDIKLNKKISFKKLCISYENAKNNNNLALCNAIESSYPLILEAYNKLGKDKLSALKYRQTNILNELTKTNKLKSDEQKIVSILDLKVGQLVNKSEIKQQLQSIYNMLDINKKAKAADLAQWYTVKDHTKKQGDVYLKMFKIITCNINV